MSFSEIFSRCNRMQSRFRSRITLPDSFRACVQASILRAQEGIAQRGYRSTCQEARTLEGLMRSMNRLFQEIGPHRPHGCRIAVHRLPMDANRPAATCAASRHHTPIGDTMHRFAISLALLIVFGTATLAAAADAFFFRDGDRVVMIGDSITEQHL